MKKFTHLLLGICFLFSSQSVIAQCTAGATDLSLCDPIIVPASGAPSNASCFETINCAGLTTEYFIVDVNSIITTPDDPATPDVDESLTGPMGPEILGTSPAGMIDLATYTGEDEACVRIVPICYDLAALQSLVSNMVLGNSCCAIIESQFAGVCQTVADLGFNAMNPPQNLADVTLVINAFNTDPVTGDPLPISVAFFQSVADGVNAEAGLLGLFCGGAASVPIGYCTDQTVGTDYNIVVCPLAIELASFEGVNTKKGNELTWTTSNETNNEYFSVERSKDGINFKEIGIVEGAGYSEKEIVYSFLDDKVSGEMNYYRIASVSYYSQVEYTSIVSLKSVNSTTMVGVDVTPNPVKSSVTLSFDSDKIGDANIMIVDATGKVMANYNIDVAIGYNELVEDLSELSNGLYMAVIRIGDTTATEKFLKL